MKKIFIYLIYFGVFIFIFLFLTVGIKQIFSENLIEPALTHGIAASNDTLSAGTIATLNNFKTQYDEDWFNYDLFFLVLVLSFTTIAITSSYKSSKLGWRSFFGYLTAGSWLFLVLISMITQVTDWLLLNFYTNLFDTTLIHTPIIDWFIQYLGFYTFGLFLVCLLINQVDFLNILRSRDGRVED